MQIKSYNSLYFGQVCIQIVRTAIKYILELFSSSLQYFVLPHYHRVYYLKIEPQ